MKTKQKPIKPQYRWFILSPTGELCWPCGMTRKTAIMFFCEWADRPLVQWRCVEAPAGYLCVRLLVSQPERRAKKGKP